MVYYNENDPNAVAWLRQLITDRLIAYGHVDDRSIVDVQPNDLDGYTQHHFFAGIGGWSLALRRAGVSDDEPAATASCPCQPLSCAGLGLGEKDERHLWPELYRLVSERRFGVLYGEQVSSPDGLEWIDGVSLDLEELGYAVTAFDYPSAGVGAPNRRQRFYWVANAISEQPHRDRDQRRWGGESPDDRTTIQTVADAHDPRSQGRSIEGDRAGEWSPWARSVGILGSDGEWRRAEPGIFPVAPRLPGNVALIRGAGNAINVAVAARFIQAHRLARANPGLTELILS